MIVHGSLLSDYGACVYHSVHVDLHKIDTVVQSEAFLIPLSPFHPPLLHRMKLHLPIRLPSVWMVIGFTLVSTSLLKCSTLPDLAETVPPYELTVSQYM